MATMRSNKSGPRYTQSFTKVPSTCCGGSSLLKGHIILAALDEVVSPSFWEANPNIGAIVNCLHHADEVQYPQHSATSQRYSIEVRHHNESTRSLQFEHAYPNVAGCLTAGQDVVVHCRESYHRAPLVAAMLLSRATGVGYQVS